MNQLHLNHQLNIIHNYLNINQIQFHMFKNLQTETKAVINKVQISLNPDRFIEDSNKINHNDIYILKAIILKVLSKILPSEAIFESYAQVSKVEFTGSATETLPQGKEKAFKGEIKLYKIVGQVFTKTELWVQKISEFYFHCQTFNIFTLNDGKITKQINIQTGEEKQVNQVIKGIQADEQEVIERKVQKKVKKDQSKGNEKKMNLEIQTYQQNQRQLQWLRINSLNIYTDQTQKKKQQEISNKPKNKKQYIKSRLEKQVKEKNWGYNQMTFHQKQQNNMNLLDDNHLLQQLNQTLVKIGIIVELYSHTLQRKFKLSAQVQIINPNRTIKQGQFKNEQVIKIQDADNLSYYFSNPELLPIFIKGTVPQEILEYNKQVNQQMQQIRKNQTENMYENEYYILTREFIAGAKIYIYEGDTAQHYGGTVEPKKWLNKSGFQVIHEVRQTQKLRSQNYNLIWITSSSSNTLSNDDVDYIVNQYQQGVGLFLWGDNQPYYFEANQILARIVSPQYQLIGDYVGMKLLKASSQLNIGTFDINHPVASGFATLHEGATICSPNMDHPDIQVFAYNTNPQKQYAIVYRRPKNNEGYLWVDTGYTKYLRYDGNFDQIKNEVEQYVINVCSFIMKKKKI